MVLFCLEANFKGKQANMDRFDGSCGRNDMKIVMTLDGFLQDRFEAVFNTTLIVNEDIQDSNTKVCIGKWGKMKQFKKSEELRKYQV